jgi:hypothetical protein
MKAKKPNRSIERQERLLIYFSTAQRKALAAAAKRHDTSTAALIREGLDLVIKAKRSGK